MASKVVLRDSAEGAGVATMLAMVLGNPEPGSTAPGVEPAPGYGMGGMAATGGVICQRWGVVTPSTALGCGWEGSVPAKGSLVEGASSFTNRPTSRTVAMRKLSWRAASSSASANAAALG